MPSSASNPAQSPAAQPNIPPVVQASNLSVQRGEHVLCSGVTLSLATGEALQVLGDNGAGKSTLLATLAGLLPVHTGQLSMPESIKLTFLGHKAMVFTKLSVLDNLTYYSKLDTYKCTNPKSGRTTSNNIGTSHALLSSLQTVDLLELSHIRAAKLSSGQGRRLGLARLWHLLSVCDSCHDQLWVLDEPLTALDKVFIPRFEAMLVDFLTQGGRVVFTSHQPLLSNLPKDAAGQRIAVKQLDLAHFSSASVDTMAAPAQQP